VTYPARRLRVAAFPRDPNPYQRLLYEDMDGLGVDVSYLGELTSSRMVNLVLLPAELAVRRARGLDIVHLHWVFGFALPLRRKFRVLGALSEGWFRLFLWNVAHLDLALVWTAHNVLPHSPVFWDDVEARQRLGSASDLVLVHSEEARSALSSIGVQPRWTAVVPHGPYPVGDARAGTAPDPEAPFTFAFVGAVESRKGVLELVAAFLRLPDDGSRLVVAGRCADPSIAEGLRSAAARAGTRIELTLRWLDDDEIASVLAAADVLVLPYQKVTTSGAAVLGLSAGVPLLVPDLPGFAGLPVDSVIRYPHDGGLDSGLLEALRIPRSTLRAMGRRGRAEVTAVPWSDISAATARLYRDVLASRRGASRLPALRRR
jgi:glycosyltransferase involved in cell wall biosynthesis